MKPLYPTLCTAALLMLAACTTDLAEDLQHEVPGTGTLPEGTFIVDYTADTDGAQTRADDDTKRPIQSLDYLLYEKTANADAFTLKKHKTLTFDPDTQKWPLTRKNLSWEHREALKDTLNTACQYKMVFVANAAASIWDGTEVLQSVTEGADFEDGRLVLPPRVFTEDDMYYMWSNHDAPLNGKSYGEGNPAKVAILLKRMINKVEVKLDEEVVQAISNTTITDYKEYKTKVDEYKTKILSTYYNTYYANTENNSGKLYDQVSAYLNKLNEKCTYYPGESPVTVSHQDKTLFKNTYLGETGRNNLVTSINDTSDGVKQEFIRKAKPLLQCNWKDVDHINVKYATGSYPQSIDFSKKTWAGTTDGTIKGQLNRDNEFCYTFYAFGNNEEEEKTLNKIQSIEFVRNDNAEETFEISNIGIIPNGKTTYGNNYFELIYNPTQTENINIETIDSNNNETYFTFTKEGFSLMTLGWTWDTFKINGAAWKQDNMEDWLNEGLEDAGINGTWNSMTLSLDIPMIKIINAWGIVE